MALSPALLEILVDPEDKEPLLYFASEAVLYNPRRKLAYAVRDGIPVLLVNEARALDNDEVARLEAMVDTAISTGSPSPS